MDAMATQEENGKWQFQGRAPCQPLPALASPCQPLPLFPFHLIPLSLDLPKGIQPARLLLPPAVGWASGKVSHVTHRIPNFVCIHRDYTLLHTSQPPPVFVKDCPRADFYSCYTRPIIYTASISPATLISIQYQ